MSKKSQETDLRKIFESEKHLANEPFFFQGTNRKGVLLVHGWTCTPYELRRLGQFLNSAGYTVSGIMLSGHGTKSSDLEKVSWRDWIDDAEKGYRKLKEKCDKVYVAGTSIGGSVTMALAKKNPSISGLVLMATPFKLRYEKIAEIFLKSSLFFGIRYRKKHYPPGFGSSGLVTRLIGYQENPVSSMLDVVSIVRDARRNIVEISQPCLIMQSTHDHIVTKNSADNIYSKIGSEVKRKKMIEKAYHTFIADIKNEHIFEDILNFIEKN